jgi:hypothetical protein
VELEGSVDRGHSTSEKVGCLGVELFGLRDELIE